MNQHTINLILSASSILLKKAFRLASAETFNSVLILVFLFSFSVHGQIDTCDFAPVINEGDFEMLSSDSVFLTTQEYDDYQWFDSTNGNEFALVDTSSVVGLMDAYPGIHYFYLEAAQGDCVVMSDTIEVSIYNNDCGMALGYATINQVVCGGFLEVCVGYDLSIELAISPGDYSWYMVSDGGDTTLVGTGGLVELYMNTPGVYEIYGTASCGNSIVVNGPSTVISVYPNWQPPLEGIEINQIGEFLVTNQEMGVNYIWLYGDEVIEGENTNSLQVEEIGNYSVQLQPLCGNLVYAEFVVFNRYGCGFIPIIEGSQGNIEICENDSIMLTTQSYDSYAWYGGTNLDSLELLSTDSVFTPEMDLGVNYWYLAATLDSCTYLTDTVSVIVYSSWQPNSEEEIFLSQYGDTLIVDIYNLSDDYTWYYDGVIIAGENDNYIVIDQPGEYSVNVGMFCWEETFSLIIAGNCNFTPFVFGGDQSLLAGDSIALTTQLYDQYNWYVNFYGGETVLMDTSATLDLYNLNQGVITVFLEVTLDSCTLVSDTISLTVYFDDCDEVGPPYIDSDDITLCEGDTLFVSSETVYPAYNIWLLSETGSSFEEISFSENLEVVLAPGEYDLLYHLTVSDNCVFNSNTIHVSVLPNWTPPEDGILISQTGEILSTYFHIDATYFWSFNGEELEGENANFIIANQYGSYNVEMIMPCGEDSVSFQYNDVSIIESNRLFEIYPNPVSEVLTIKTVNGFCSKIELVDIVGRVVYSHDNIGAVSNSIDISFLNNGNYFLRMLGREEEATIVKIVVLK